MKHQNILLLALLFSVQALRVRDDNDDYENKIVLPALVDKNDENLDKEI